MLTTMQVGRPINPFARRMTSAVMMIMIACAVIFLMQVIVEKSAGGTLNVIFGLHLSTLLRGFVWQPVTYIFLHGSLIHILMNMLILYFFGCEMEEVLGTRRFLKLYFGTGALAGLGWVLVDGVLRQTELPCVGASGAVFGVIGAFAAMFPKRVITLLVFFVLPVTMTARAMAIGMAAISLVLLVKSDGNVAHASHLAGGIAGYLYGMGVARNPTSIDPMMNPPSAGFISNIRARLLRREMHVIGGEEEPPSPEEVDRILEKIKKEGIGKLSRKDRRILDQASKR